jgi:hypothetical protein
MDIRVTREGLAAAMAAAGIDGRDRAAEVWAQLGGDPQPLHDELVRFLHDTRLLGRVGHRIGHLATLLIASGLVRQRVPTALEAADHLALAEILMYRDGQPLAREAAEAVLREAGLPGEEG